MSYANTTDLEERLGEGIYLQLTDDAGTGSADEGKASEALEQAEGEVNSYLARRYAVPVDVSVDAQLAAILKSVTLDLAEYRLHARRPPIPEDKRRQREAAVRWLGQASSGQVVLPAVNEVQGHTVCGISGEVTGSPRVISREALERL